jgi:hypothetical protein
MLDSLVLECAMKGIPASIFYNKEKNRIEYEIQIGSKTGTGKLYQESEEVILETRYQTIDKVSTFDDIANVAYRWFSNYQDREPFTSPDGQWAKIFLQKGWIKIQTETKYVIAR